MSLRTSSLINTSNIIYKYLYTQSAGFACKKSMDTVTMAQDSWPESDRSKHNMPEDKVSQQTEEDE